MQRPPFKSSLDAETAFYSAFEEADLDKMMAVWDSTARIVCIHPAAPRLVGPAQIRESWRHIFAGGPSMRFAIAERQVIETAELALHVVHEIITVVGEAAPRGPILATNAYRRTADGWLLVLHHASPVTGVQRQAAPGSIH